MNTTRSCFPEMRCAEPWSSLVLCKPWPRRAAHSTSSPGDRRLVLRRPPVPRIVGLCGDWKSPLGLAPLVLWVTNIHWLTGEAERKEGTRPWWQPKWPLEVNNTTPPHQEPVSNAGGLVFCQLILCIKFRVFENSSESHVGNGQCFT